MLGTSDDRLRIDLAAARRADGMISDPLSRATLRAYINELERALDRANLVDADAELVA